VLAGYLPGEDTAPLKQGTSERLALIPIDLTQGESIRAAAETVTRQVGDAGLYGLVNNAGIGITGPLEFIPMAALRQQLEVNFFGHVALTQALLPQVRRATGRIVNTVSVLGRVVTPFSGPYCASKFAMEAFTDALRLELQPWGIQVVAIQPGIIKTPIWAKVRDNLDEVEAELPPQLREYYGVRLKRTRQSVQAIDQTASDPDVVAQAIVSALMARRPKTRYTVGKEARLVIVLRWLLPDRWLDALITRRYTG
jgi:NAD(P)-dependent dehydrogenase (short-subunit alcohol dehydrogenase family)